MNFLKKLFSPRVKTPEEQFLEAFEKSQYPLAVELSKKVVIESDDNLSNRIAIAYSKVGDFEVSLKYYKMTAAIQRRKGRVSDSTLSAIAKKAYTLKRWTEVIRTVQEIEASWIKDVDKYDDFELTGMLGTSFQNEGLFQQAIESYKGARLNSANLSANQKSMLKYTAQCYEQLGNRKQALSFYQKYLKHDFSDEIREKIAELS